MGQVSFGNVWGLLVDGAFDPGLPPAEPFPIPVHSGDLGWTSSPRWRCWRPCGA